MRCSVPRLGKTGEIVAFEPQQQHMDELQESLGQQVGTTRIRLVQSMISDAEKPGVATLDSVKRERGNESARSDTLIKIDVEGAELEVLRGAHSWMEGSNYFVIEVHQEPYLEQISHVFAEHQLRLIRIDQRPFPLLGREMREGKLVVGVSPWFGHRCLKVGTRDAASSDAMEPTSSRRGPAVGIG